MEADEDRRPSLMLCQAVMWTIPLLGGPTGGQRPSHRNACRTALASGAMTEATTAIGRACLRVLVHSDNARTRGQIIQALGTRPRPDLPEIGYLEVATSSAIVERVDAGDIDLAILDGEATPAGGMGVAKQLRDEVDRCPPILILIGRSGDAWLARWSRADAAVPHPIDPVRLAEAALPLLRSRQSGGLPW